MFRAESKGRVDQLRGVPVQPRAGYCPDCGHQAEARLEVARLRLPGRLPRAAACRRADGVDDPSGWPTECGCTAAFHGS